MWAKLYLSKYYEQVTDLFYWNQVPFKRAPYVFKRFLWKLKPEFEDRMIRAGYGRDTDNKSMGKYFDIERAFQGFPGPLTRKLNHRFKNWQAKR
jgi:hypothetical protein